MKTMNDYDASDGLVSGIEKCPHCDQGLAPREYSGTIYAPDGRTYDYITETDPNDRPFFCDECWPELDANRRKEENTSLTDY